MWPLRDRRYLNIEHLILEKTFFSDLFYLKFSHSGKERKFKVAGVKPILRKGTFYIAAYFFMNSLKMESISDIIQEVRENFTKHIYYT